MSRSRSPGEVLSDPPSPVDQKRDAPSSAKTNRNSEDREKELRQKLLDKRAQIIKETKDSKPARRKHSPITMSPPTKRKVTLAENVDDEGDSIMEDFPAIRPPQAAPKPSKKHKEKRSHREHRDRERERGQSSSQRSRDNSERGDRERPVQYSDDRRKIPETWSSWKESLGRGEIQDSRRGANRDRRPLRGESSGRGRKPYDPPSDRTNRGSDRADRPKPGPAYNRKSPRDDRKSAVVCEPSGQIVVGHLSPHSPSPPADDNTPVQDETNAHDKIYGQPIAPRDQTSKQGNKESSDSSSSSSEFESPVKAKNTKRKSKSKSGDFSPPEMSTKKGSGSEKSSSPVCGQKKYSKFESSPEEEGQLNENSHEMHVTNQGKQIQNNNAEGENGDKVHATPTSIHSGEDASPMKDDSKCEVDLGHIDSPMTSPITEDTDEMLIAKLPSYFPGLSGCRSVEEFHCLNRIEEGTYGVVYRAEEKRTGQ